MNLSIQTKITKDEGPRIPEQICYLGLIIHKATTRLHNSDKERNRGETSQEPAMSN